MKVLEEAPASGEYPFIGSNKRTYSAGGRFSNSWLDKFDLIELIQDEHGWRPWNATKDSVCPVPDGAKTRIRWSDGVEESWLVPQKLDWSEVVAYKVIEEAQQ